MMSGGDASRHGVATLLFAFVAFVVSVCTSSITIAQEVESACAASVIVSSDVAVEHLWSHNRATKMCNTDEDMDAVAVRNFTSVVMASSHLSSDVTRNNHNVCLVMIVRNEEHVIERSLTSVLPYVDCWCIVDTGSTDSTPDIVLRLLQAKSGSLHHRPWVNFAHNRNEALALARPMSSWSFMMDADEIFHGPFVFQDNVSCDAYSITRKRGSLTYQSVLFFNTSQPWVFVGALHEYPTIEGLQPDVQPFPDTLWLDARTEGARSLNPRKYEDDALLLEIELAEGEPYNMRTVFYCAQSWRDAGNASNARHWYAVHAAGDGWVQERYMALVNLIRLTDDLSIKLQHAWDAYQLVPERLEATHDVLLWARGKGLWAQQAFWLAYANARTAKLSSDYLFVENDVYAYQFHDEYSIYAYWTAHFEEALAAAKAALVHAPESQKKRMIQNVAYSQQRVDELSQPVVGK
jgi:glycosyltransferase involved in cell wall biosynthesis